MKPWPLALLVLSCAPKPTPARTPAHEPSALDLARAQIEAAVAGFSAATQVPGVAVAIVEQGHVAWTFGFGFADLENRAPVTEHTLFRLASISKSLTATATMKLVEQGKLDLDAPVRHYCSAFPEKPWPITTRQVLAHVGGIRHYRSESPDDPEISSTKRCDDPVRVGLGFFVDDPLVAEPGTRFHYSTHGYTLVGCVMEGATRAKYVDLVRENVLGPAGMSETQPDDRLAVVAHRTRFYRKTESSPTVTNADVLDSCYKLPGGGWLSSASDMARFEVAMLNDRLLRRETRDRMWSAPPPAPGSKGLYALGWRIGNEDGTATVGHTGAQQGTSTALLMAPAAKAGVVVLANMENVRVGELAKVLLRIVVGRSTTPAEPPRAFLADPPSNTGSLGWTAEAMSCTARDDG